ncbi:MAG: thiolase domain-containing protein [Chloroflexota bacterium]
MRGVSIVGVGQVPVGEHWDRSLRMLASDAIIAAMQDAGIKAVDALYVGNAYGGTVSAQTQIGAMVADYTGLAGVESYSVEAGDASGAAALRTGYMAVSSGAVDVALVVGVEKLTDAIAGGRVSGRSVSLDADYEAVHGATLPAMAALMMRRYMHEYDLELSAFEGFSVNAHLNGSKNANAMFRNKLREGAFAKAPMVASPVSLFDGAPDADGAAAVVLVASDVAQDMVPEPVRIVGSAVATDTLAIQDRVDLLWLNAVAQSTEKAFKQADVDRHDIDLFELHDGFTVLSALSLEAAGYAERGVGWQHASSIKRIALTGGLPISTFGGLKARGNPAGATGVYQAVEAAVQLRGEAGDNQVPDARAAMIQNLGGLASTAVTHILTL